MQGLVQAGHLHPPALAKRGRCGPVPVVTQERTEPAAERRGYLEHHGGTAVAAVGPRV